MYYGNPPFYEKDKKKMYMKILTDKIPFDLKKIPEDAEDFIKVRNKILKRILTIFFFEKKLLVLDP
jgi:hypothetical protein